MKKQYIIPIFVPHLGCPQNCTFCNQKTISGQQKQVTKDDVKNIIDNYLNYFGDKKDIQVAFFGGRFTAIEEEKQKELLEAAYKYIENGKIESIRISTRPDAINKKILKNLKKYKVKVIELGVQSSNDYILNKCKRGHNFDDVKKASKLIRRHRFVLGHQMMVGLPESTRLDELNTARDLAKLKPKIMRIYPVLVIKGTKLEEEYENGEYVPLEVVQAVEICKDLCMFFEKKHIEVIRVGLQNTDTISSPNNKQSEVVAGPYHEAFGQLVEDAIWYQRVLEKIKEINDKIKEVAIHVNPENVNNVVGHKRENLKRLKETYNVDATVVQDADVSKDKVFIETLKTYSEYIEQMRQK